MKLSLKSIISALSLGVIAASPLARSQEAPPPPNPDDHSAPPPRARGLTEQLKEKLNLTDEQSSQVMAIFGKQKEAMMALRDDDSLSAEDRRARMKEFMKSTHDQIRALLTPAQQKIFDAMPPPKWGRPPPPPPPEQ